MQWNVFLDPNTKNKDDRLTRMPKYWRRNSVVSIGAVGLSASKDLVEHSHSLHHSDVNTTLHFAQQVDPKVSKDEVD